MDNDTLVAVEVEALKGVGLRYMLVTALGLTFTIHQPTYGLGHRISLKGDREFFRPDINWMQAGPLIETHWRETTAWLTEHFGPNWRDNIDGKPGRLLLWLCRGIVGGKTGQYRTGSRILTCSIREMWHGNQPDRGRPQRQ